MVGPMAGAQRVGVIGGSFNPIHLGHALLAITVKETKPVDEVVLVPVFKHPVKTDLMPFEDRVAMCELAVQANGIEVSRVEQETGESNAVMLRALRRKYPEGTQLLWVCGDDVFEWIDNVKGREMLCELDGLIVQRRLHQSDGGRSTDNFYKAPLDVSKVQALAAEYSVMIDFIYGELPHFSSTLVRNSPASWRAFLPQKVAAYIDERPGLLAQLVRTGDAPELPPITPTLSAACPDGTPHSLPKLPSLSSSCSNLSVDEQSFQSLLPEDPLPQHLPVLLGSLGPHIVAHILEKPQLVLDGCSPERGKTEELRLHSNAWREHAACFAQLASSIEHRPQRLREASTSCVIRCLALVHSLQRERGRTALAMALGDEEEVHQSLLEARAATDALLRDDLEAELPLRQAGAAAGAAGDVYQELRRTSMWLAHDREVLDYHLKMCSPIGSESPRDWVQRACLLDKFNARVDVLIDLECMALDSHGSGYSSQDEQGFGDTTKDWLLEVFQHYSHCKEALGRLRALVCAGGRNAPAMFRSSLRARRRLNEAIEHKERTLQRVVSTERSSPAFAQHPGALTVAALHKMLASISCLEWELLGCLSTDSSASGGFDVHQWWGALSSAIDLMLKLDQALAAHICAYDL